ncbi:MAG: hypothetical protein M3Q36_00825 [bacterium]|nr:hypothetical protein [bacterium]
MPTLYNPEEYISSLQESNYIEQIEFESLSPDYFQKLEENILKSDGQLYDFLVSQSAALAPLDPTERKQVFRALLLTFSVATQREQSQIQPHDSNVDTI